MNVCGNDDCSPCALRLALFCTQAYAEQIGQRAFIISEARLKKAGVQIVNPMTGDPGVVQICAWHALSPPDKVAHAMRVALELVARN